MKAPYRTKEITVHLANICHSDHTIQCTATSNAPTLHARWKRKNRIARLKHTIAKQRQFINALWQENSRCHAVAAKLNAEIAALKRENAQLWQGLYNLATAPKR